MFRDEVRRSSASIVVLFLIGSFIVWKLCNKRSSSEDFTVPHSPVCDDGDKNQKCNVIDVIAEDWDPNTVRLLCWNIEGLENKHTFVARTVSVCETINRKAPEVVFLQEVIPETIRILKDRCKDYQVIVGGDQYYFTAIMLHMGHARHEETTIVPFPNSRMLRNLLIVKCTIKGVKFELITSHLESTQPSHVERKRQLVVSFDKMNEADVDRTVVFGGDLNLVDEELTEVGGIPEGLLDLWEETGQNPNTRYTWDSQLNDNLFAGGHSRERLDRLYMRHCKPPICVKPVMFELVGTGRLPCGQFPSDHWGLLTEFVKTDNASHP